MAYARKACDVCGKLERKNEMISSEKLVTTGYSQAAVSKRSLLTDIFFESKSANKQNTNWFTGNTKRKYTRNKTFWYCHSCALDEGIIYTQKEKPIYHFFRVLLLIPFQLIHFLIWLGIRLFILYAIVFVVLLILDINGIDVLGMMGF